jgi:hypothetical protein
VWLIKVVTQRIPFDLAVEKIATGTSRELTTGLKGAPEWEEDPRFSETITGMERMMETSSVRAAAGTGTAVGRAAVAATSRPVRREPVMRVVVVGETTAPGKESYVSSEFLKKLTEDQEGPEFLDAIMLTVDSVEKYLDASGRPANLDQQTLTMIRQIDDMEKKRQEGNETLTPAEEALPRKDTYLRTLREQKGVRPVKFLQFTAAFFVDDGGLLSKRIEERKKELEKTTSTPTARPVAF